MQNLDLELEYFIRSLINWIEYPGANSMFFKERLYPYGVAFRSIQSKWKNELPKMF